MANRDRELNPDYFSLILVALLRFGILIGIPPSKNQSLSFSGIQSESKPPGPKPPINDELKKVNLLKTYSYQTMVTISGWEKPSCKSSHIPLWRRFSGFPKLGYVIVPRQGTKVRGIESDQQNHHGNKSQGYGHWWVWVHRKTMKNLCSWKITWKIVDPGLGVNYEQIHATNYISTSVFFAIKCFRTTQKKQNLKHRWK